MSAVAKVVYKVVGIGSGVLAAKVARSALDKGWARTKGGEPPRNPAVPGTSWSEALTWAVASGVAVAVARLVATKGVASTWVKATGQLPPGVEDVGN
ncbi:MAG TPA: DUF4235 domain-containing protein [Mycobacteriales bacterium]|jgi:hypothetical protein|nr:DUF4235 domain-containing protein [Mycobacteriales bacterium]